MEKETYVRMFIERIKKIKNIEYFIFILAIAIIIGLFGNWFQPKEDIQAVNENYDSSDTQQAVINDEDSDQEYRLKKVLSTIKGAGRVEVMITYKSGAELIPAMNTVESNTETEERDSNGGIRKVSQVDSNSQPVSMSTSEGTKPLITREVQPEVLGVIVVAEGAEDIRVQMELQKAVQTVLGVDSNQVDIFIMRDKE
ncbi:MAG: sporulation stage III protein AG [Clostridiales bacterium]|nr:sporulation stage III protein AG [Clostridiales bacterium]